MTDQEQDIAVAKALGWHYKNHHAMWVSPVGQPGFAGIPHYGSDLNACHEMEKFLTDDQYCAVLGTAAFEDCSYTGWLFRIVVRRAPYDEPNGRPYSASAPQRREAFLRTLNLYTD